MRNKSSILFIGSFPTNTVGGTSTASLALMNSEEFQKREVFTLDSTISNIRNNTWSHRIGRFIKRGTRFCKLLFTKSPGTALIFCGHGMSFVEKGIYALILKQVGVRVILAPQSGLILRNFPNFFFAYYAKIVFRHTDKIIAQGNYWKEFYSHYADAQKVQKVNNWLQPPPEFSSKSKTSSQKLNLVYLGWLEEYKGLKELMEAVRSLAQNRSDFSLEIYGSGRLDTWLQEFISQHKLSEFIALKGWASSEQKYSILSHADLLILPSHYEGMPNVIIEAHQVGTPVLASRISSIPELIENKDFLFESKRADDLSKKLEAILDNPSLLEQEQTRIDQIPASKFQVNQAAQNILREKESISPKPRVLFLSDWFSPAYRAGGPIRSASTLTQALGAEFKFSVLTYNTDLDHSTLEVPKNIPVVQPFGAVYYASNRFRWLSQFVFESRNVHPVAIHLNSVFSTRTSLFAIFFSPRRIKMILSARGMLMREALKFKSLKKTIFLKALIHSGVLKNIEFHYSTSLEKEETPSVLNTKKSWVIPNLSGILPQLSNNSKVPKSLNVLCIGRLHPIKNFHKLPQYLELVDAPLQIKIAGTLEHRELQQNMAEGMRHMEKHQLEFLGHKEAEEIKKLYDWADVLVAPSESENFGHAIVEALSKGVPVLTSHGTPWNNLVEHQAGKNIDPEDIDGYSSALSTFAEMNATQFEEFKMGALSYIGKYLNEKKNIEKYKELYLS